jgi:hypothetical protein
MAEEKEEDAMDLDEVPKPSPLGRKARSDYWRLQFPWQLAWQAFVVPGREPRPYREFKPIEDGPLEFHRHGYYRDWPDWKRTMALGETTSLHVVPHPAEFLVIDYDIRDDKPLVPCMAKGRHDVRDVCRECWDSRVQPLLTKLDRTMRRMMGLEQSATLILYSGAGGIHIWYSLRTLEPPIRKLLSTFAMRETLIHSWLTAARGMPTTLDSRPTVEAALPAHSAHAIRLPLSLHDKTGRITTPLRILDKKKCLVELPPHLRGESTNMAQSIALIRSWAGLPD